MSICICIYQGQQIKLHNYKRVSSLTLQTIFIMHEPNNSGSDYLKQKLV
jgi:hypothetical protein